ncbi:hypothetical protein GGI43DRAFT_401652 [Trichoderma evansii]
MTVYFEILLSLLPFLCSVQSFQSFYITKLCILVWVDIVHSQFCPYNRCYLTLATGLTTATVHTTFARSLPSVCSQVTIQGATR